MRALEVCIIFEERGGTWNVLERMRSLVMYDRDPGDSRSWESQKKWTLFRHIQHVFI